MKDKRINGIIWLVFIISLGILTLVLYRKDISSDKKNTNNILLNDVKKYLEYVPISNVANSINNFKDAYSGNIININNIDKQILLENVYYKCGYENTNEKVKYDLCGNVLCEANKYVSIEEFNNKSKSMYNYVNNELSQFIVVDGDVIKSDNYYAFFEARGDYKVTKVNIVKDYEELNDELIIYEQAGLIQIDNNIANIYKYHNNRSILNQISIINDNYTEAIEKGKKYIEENINNFSIFKHTFKLNKETNEYYWYQTELN